MGVCPHFEPLRALLPECPLVSLALPLPLSFPFLVWWWREGRGGEEEPMAQAWGWVAWSHWWRAWGPWTASRRSALHAACGMMACRAASSGSAGVQVRISSKVCTMCTPSCLPAPPAHFYQRRSSCKAGADHQARWAGAWGGEGSVPGVLERRGEDGDLWWWWGWRCLGERERRWRGLAVEDGYGRRGKREGELDMGRRWRAWWRLGERAWWWRGLGVVDRSGRRGERGPRQGLWGEEEEDVWRRWRAPRRQGEAGVVVAAAGGGGRVPPERGGGGGHGAAVALVVAPGGAGAAGAGSRGVVVAPGGAGAARVGG